MNNTVIIDGEKYCLIESLSVLGGEGEIVLCQNASASSKKNLAGLFFNGQFNIATFLIRRNRDAA